MAASSEDVAERLSKYLNERRDEIGDVRVEVDARLLPLYHVRVFVHSVELSVLLAVSSVVNEVERELPHAALDLDVVPAA